MSAASEAAVIDAVEAHLEFAHGVKKPFHVEQ
jgi:hypothetical protein